MNVLEKINAGEFENTLNYPTNAVLNGDPAYQALSEEQNQLLDKIEEIKRAEKALVRTMVQEYYPTEAVLNGDPTYQALSTEQNQLLDRAEEIKEAKKALVRTMVQEYDDESSIKCANFKAALEKKYGLQNHPKKEKIWQKAWDDGHSGGWIDILNTYDELVDLVL